MKKIFSLVLALIILTGCASSSPVTPTLSDAQLSTRMAQLLTATPLVVAVNPPAGTPEIKPAAPKAADLPPTPVLQTATALSQPPTPVSQPPTVAPTAAMPTTPTPPPTLAVSRVPDVPAVPVTPIPPRTSLAGDQRAILGQPTWIDTMENNRGNWPLASDYCGDGELNGGLFTMISHMRPDCPRMWRMAQTNRLKNFYLEAVGRPDLCYNSDNFGIYFRVPEYANPVSGYMFGITCEGTYGFFLYNGNNPKGSRLIDITNLGWVESGAIHRGIRNSNRLGVMALNDTISLYINGTLVKTIYNSAFTDGHIGLYIETYQYHHFTVNWDEVAYWVLN